MLRGYSRIIAHERDRHLLPQRLELGKLRRLHDFQPDIEPDGDQHEADHEADTPAPGEELRLRQTGRQRHDAGREAQSDRQPDLREAGIQPAFVLGGVFVGHRHRPAPLAAEPDALQHAQQQQQDRRGDADLLIGRQQTDQHRGDAHDHQRHHQHVLAADAVAEMAEDHAAERTGEKADREGGVGEQDRDQRILGREIQLVEDDAGDGAIKEEVVPLDGGADQAGGDDAPQIAIR